MIALLALAILPAPDPVTWLTADRDWDGTVHLAWDLPEDPSIIGVAIWRERRYHGEDDRGFEIGGLPTSFTDVTADPHSSYRYWVHTVDDLGEWSDPAVVEVDHVEHGSHHDCWASAAAAGAPPWMLLLPGLLFPAGLRRRARARP